MARRKRKSDEAPGWVWMLFGLGIGLVIALGVYINGAPPTSPPAAESTPVPPPAGPVLARPQAEADPVELSPEPAPEPESGAADTETNHGEDPNRFSFYDMLPSFEVIIPEVETPEPRTADVAAIEAPGIYVLQAGSFLTETDADAQRARLGLLGVESRIQRVSLDDRTFHRVRIGPIEDLNELNSIRTRLRAASVESIVMRMAQ
ncbi:MAG: SPOR domain-containing protein [Gammaproteobacteria bacterium]|jgi:cell division protein FtsN